MTAETVEIGRWYETKYRRVKAFTWADGPAGVEYTREGMLTLQPLRTSRAEFLAMITEATDHAR